jgi:hypothetical protein
MLAALEKRASKPVPANGAEEIRAWFASCRSLTVRRSVRIEAGDREAALRVQRVCSASVAWLSRTNCSNGAERELTPSSERS